FLGEYKKGIDEGAEAIRLSPDSRFAFYARGLSYLATNRFREAEADFDKALKLQPNWVDALFARGVAKERLGNEAAGQMDFDAAKKLEPNVAFRMAGYGVSTSVFQAGQDDIAACKTAPDA